MKKTVEILGKTVQVEWSRAAEKALDQLEQPLLVEMELLFSCLIRKAVRFRQEADPEKFVLVTPKLKVRFRPVMTKVCRLSDIGEGVTPLQDFPIKKPAAFVPRLLALDFVQGQWRGEFQIGKADDEGSE